MRPHPGPAPSPHGALNVHFARAGVPGEEAAIDGFLRLAGLSTVGHRVVGEMADADLILFTQAHLCSGELGRTTLRRSEAWRTYRHRSFVIDWSDRPWCAFPGLYTSMPRASFVTRWQRSWLYPWIDEDSFIALRNRPTDLLFSFVGARTHPCRSGVLELKDSLSVIVDSGTIFLEGTEDDERRRRFLNTMGRSRFILCPRGHGTCSFRLQEALAAGRVPVVISDNWMPPRGPNWEDAILQWPESKVSRLPQHLRTLEGQWESMSLAAATIFDTFFRSNQIFDAIIDQILALRPHQPFPHSGARNREYWRLRAALLRGRIRRLGSNTMVKCP